MTENKSFLQVKKQEEKYANGSVGARVRLMVRGCVLPDDLCETKETEIHVIFEYKCSDQMRRDG